MHYHLKEKWKELVMGEENRTPAELGPYLNAAFLCEKMLRE
jgi:hypothetical protein